MLDELREAVGEEHVLVDDGMTASYRSDWTGRWSGRCLAVVRPADTTEVSAVVRACAARGVAVVTQGGNTGLVGGAVPVERGIVVSTSRLDGISEVDDASGQLTAGAGATIEAVQDAARRAGWRYPIDLAARGSATVGGTIATNAGGHHVIRHGMTRRHVLGVEAVLADGSVLSHLGGLVKDNTGYDLAGLLCGSEGTLGVVTAARLELVAPDVGSAVALVGFATIDDAVSSLGALRRSLPGVEAIEVMFDDGMSAVAEHRGARPPIEGCPVVLLVESVGQAEPADALVGVIARLDGVVDSAIADDAPRRAELWQWRDAHTETISALGATPPHKLDVTVPLARWPEFVGRVRGLAGTRPEARLWLFGHAGDGNLHVNLTGLPPDDDSLDEEVVAVVAELGGSISAEHGIGRAKRAWLHLNRSPAEIATFRAIKAALDPAGILNPGVLLPDDPSGP